MSCFYAYPLIPRYSLFCHLRRNPHRPSRDDVSMALVRAEADLVRIVFAVRFVFVVCDLDEIGVDDGGPKG